MRNHLCLSEPDQLSKVVLDKRAVVYRFRFLRSAVGHLLQRTVVVAGIEYINDYKIYPVNAITLMKFCISGMPAQSMQADVRLI